LESAEWLVERVSSESNGKWDFGLGRKTQVAGQSLVMALREKWEVPESKEDGHLVLVVVVCSFM
jgi:hypothetical protein